MTTKIIDGNILDSTADVIAHQVNCQFVMGSGVAKAIRNKYPHVYLKYTQMNHSMDKMKSDSSQYLGECQMVPMVDGDLNEGYHMRYVANLFGQDYYGNDGKQYTNYQALQCALYSLKRFVLFNPYKNVKTIALPYGLGCGLGGGEWYVVRNIIEDVFYGTDIEIQYWRLLKEVSNKLSEEQFLGLIQNYVDNRPSDLRKGQATFNYVDEMFGVARVCQANGIDCFYDDENVDEFLKEAYKNYIENKEY